MAPECAFFSPLWGAWGYLRFRSRSPHAAPKADDPRLDPLPQDEPEPAPSELADLCVELDCHPCAQDNRCVEGDALVQLSDASEGSEVVDAATDGEFVVLCGGFGATIVDIRDPAATDTIGGAGRRCQNAEFGPVLADDRRVFYVAHHGDSWVESPSLETHVIENGTVKQLDSVPGGNTLFEGMAYEDGFLYATAHAGGLRIYRVDEEGIPRFSSILPGFENAVEVVVEDGLAYVADRVLGVIALSLANPAEPKQIQTVETNGIPRDLEIANGRLYVPLGSAGVDVFDVDDGFLRAIANIPSTGATQQVAATDDLVALANWSHVAVHDAKTLALLATERTRPTPEFEQDLGVAISGRTILAGEWEGLHTMEFRPDHVAPDISIDQELVNFDFDVPGESVVVVRNRGALDLDVEAIESIDGEFSPDPRSMVIPSGGAAAFEVAYAPVGTPVFGALSIRSNDPDDDQRPFILPVNAEESTLLGVGDRLHEEFDFLDLEGTGDVDNLEGNVIVLAYFALF